jgi:hypothetical protein
MIEATSPYLNKPLRPLWEVNLQRASDRLARTNRSLERTVALGAENNRKLDEIARLLGVTPCH